MEFEYLGLEANDSFVTITLDRPEALNALCDELPTELPAALGEFERAAEIGCVILTGSKKAFAAGADIKELQSRDFAGLYVIGLQTFPWCNLRRCRPTFPV